MDNNENNEINEPKDILQILEKYIEKKIDEGVMNVIESNKHDDAIISECLLLALKFAKIPMREWDSIFKHVESEMRKDGCELTL